MKRYSVEVSRTLRDVQWRAVIVEADDVAKAKELALLAAADEDGTFWNNAKTYPVESTEPEIDDVEAQS